MSRIDYGQVPACPKEIGKPCAILRRVSDIELKRGSNWTSRKWIPARMTNMKKRFSEGAQALVGYNPRTGRWRVLQVREPRRG